MFSPSTLEWPLGIRGHHAVFRGWPWTRKTNHPVDQLAISSDCPIHVVWVISNSSQDRPLLVRNHWGAVHNLLRPGDVWLFEAKGPSSKQLGRNQPQMGVTSPNTWMNHGDWSIKMRKLSMYSSTNKKKKNKIWAVFKTPCLSMVLDFMNSQNGLWPSRKYCKNIENYKPYDRHQPTRAVNTACSRPLSLDP